MSNKALSTATVVATVDALIEKRITWDGTDPVLRTPDSVTNTQSSKVRRWEQNDTQTHLNWRQSAR